MHTQSKKNKDQFFKKAKKGKKTEKTKEVEEEPVKPALLGTEP
jgi:hypothetical protein